MVQLFVCHVEELSLGLMSEDHHFNRSKLES